MVQLWTDSQPLSTHNCNFQKPQRLFRVSGLSRSFLTVHDAEASLDNSKVYKTTLGNDGNSMKGVLVPLSLWIHTTKFYSMALCGGRLDILKRCHLPRQLFPEGKMGMTKQPIASWTTPENALHNYEIPVKCEWKAAQRLRVCGPRLQQGQRQRQGGGAATPMSSLSPYVTFRPKVPAGRVSMRGIFYWFAGS